MRARQGAFSNLLSRVGFFDVVSYEKFINSLFKKAELSGVPLSGSFELTSRCNLNCKMCYIHSSAQSAEAVKREKTAEWWLSVAKEAQQKGMLLALITGGEPLLRADFEELYLGLKAMGLLVSVNTNGTLIDEKKVELFKKYPPQRLNISLYGTSPKTYEGLCGDGEAYVKVMSALKMLKEAGVPVKLNFTVTPYNACDTSEVLKLSRELELPVQPTFHMFPPVRCEKCESVRLAPEAAARAQYEWHRERLGEKILKASYSKLDFSAFTERSVECGEKIGCRAGSATFWITWEGVLTPCGMMNSPAVILNSPSELSEAWETIKKEREKIFLPIECANCEYRLLCDVCAAVTAAETGEFDKKPEYACKKARAYKKLLEEQFTDYSV